MPTMLSHIKVKPESIARWEEILRALAAHTHGHEPNVLRYEYWRGQEPGRYYALLSYPDSHSFYAHQGSDTHDEYLDDFRTMFDELTLEWVDPVDGGGSGLPPTEDHPLPAGASEKVKAQVPLYPISVADWWRSLRP